MIKKFLSFLLIIFICGSSLAQGLTDFTANDLNGSIYDESVFSDYDITIVNIWVTWCKWCIYEMPQLSKLKSILPSNINLITICSDADINTSQAQKLLIENNAYDIVTLIPDKYLIDSFLYQIHSYPTTYFLDRTGNVVGDPMTGVPAPYDSIADSYCRYAADLWDIIKDY